MTRRRKLLLWSLPLGLLLALLILLYSSWGLALGLRIVAHVLPGQFSVVEEQGSLLGPLHLHGLRYRVGQFNLTIQQLDLDWHLPALLGGKLAVTSLSADGVDIDIPAQTRQDGQAQEINALPVMLDIQQASINKVAIRMVGDAQPTLIDQLTLRGQANARTITLDSFTIAGYQARASLSGTIGLAEYYPLDLALDIDYTMDAKRALHGRGRLNGDLRKLHLHQALSGLLQAKLDAEVKDIVTDLHWTGRLDVSHLDVHQLVAQSPELRVQGKLKGNGDLKSMHLDSQLELRNKRIGLAQIQFKGDSDLRLTDYRFIADTDFVGVDLPLAKFRVQGKGNLQQIDVAKIQMHTLNGEVQGHARLRWQPQLTVDARLAMHGLQTAVLNRDWPGRLSGEFSLKSEPATKRQLLHFTLHKLSGELRGYPVHGEIDGAWAQDELALDKLQMKVGGTQLTAHGSLAKQWNVRVHARSDNLNSVLPEARGRFELNGHLQGNAKAPRLIVSGDANQLVYARNAIDSLSMKLDLGLARQAAAQVDIQARAVQMHNMQWDSLRLQSDGTNAAHAVMLDASNNKTALHAQLHGEFTPWRWHGRLAQFSFTQAQYGKWELQQPVNIVLAQQQYQFSRLCLIQNGSHLCAQGQWDSERRYARADADALPLILLAPWLPPNIQLTGQVDMQANLNMTRQGEVEGHLLLQSPARSVVINFPEVNEALTLGASSFTAELNKQGLHTVLHLPFDEGGGIDSKVSLPGWTAQTGLPRAQAIAANLKLDRIPADVITRFIPDLARAQGQLFADLKVGGSLGEPHLHGSAHWRDGSVLIPRVGIRIRDVSAELKSARTNVLVFEVKARSGDGDVLLQGNTHLNPEQGWPTQATLTSHKLEVSNIPEAHIVMDSQVQIHMQGSIINIDGDITVPSARLRPHTLPEGVVPVSSDVVIVHGDTATPTSSRWLLTSHLRVQLGDDVEFNGFDLRGKLRGKLRINDEPGKLALGQGEVSIVDGIYRMRGQDLTIRRGRLLFSNTFIDDPALDVEAVRVVDTVTAGVRLKGTLKQPQLTIFSEPTMSETDALAYLLVGHAFSQSTAAEGQSVSNAASALGFMAGDYLAKGLGGSLGLDELRVDVNQTTQNTSLVMGKYLSPKLYLRYYTGIAESSRIVQLQYQLSRRVQIQTESGYRGSQSVTGGDIFFTVEY